MSVSPITLSRPAAPAPTIAGFVRKQPVAVQLDEVGETVLHVIEGYGAEDARATWTRCMGVNGGRSRGAASPIAPPAAAGSWRRFDVSRRTRLSSSICFSSSSKSFENPGCYSPLIPFLAELLGAQHCCAPTSKTPDLMPGPTSRPSAPKKHPAVRPAGRPLRPTRNAGLRRRLPCCRSFRPLFLITVLRPPPRPRTPFDKNRRRPVGVRHTAAAIARVVSGWGRLAARPPGSATPIAPLGPQVIEARGRSRR